MRQFFHKSSVLILFFSSIAFVVSLGFSIINAAFIQNHSLPYFMSEHTIKLTVHQPDPQEGLNYNEFKQWLLNIDADVTVYKELSLSNGKEVYSTKISSLYSQVISGRGFTAEELKSSHSGALISSDMLDDCTKEGNHYYYVHKNEQLIVLGVIESETSVYFASLLKAFTKEKDNHVKGIFYFDADEKSEYICDELISLIQTKEPMATFEKSKVAVATMTTLKQLLGDQLIIVIAITIMLFLVLLNIFTITALWLTGKRKEIFVKKLVGAKGYQIATDLFFNYSIINIISYLFGISIAFLFTHLGIVDIETSFTLISISISFIFCLTVGAIFGGIIINRQLTKELAEIGR